MMIIVAHFPHAKKMSHRAVSFIVGFSIVTIPVMIYVRDGTSNMLPDYVQFDFPLFFFGLDGNAYNNPLLIVLYFYHS